MRFHILPVTCIAILVGCNGGDRSTDASVSGEPATRPFDRDGEVPSFVVGESQIAVSSPPGFSLLGEEGREIRERIEATNPPQNDLHAVFVEQIDLARLLDHKSPSLRRYISIQSDRQIGNQAITQRLFDEVKEKLKHSDMVALMSRNKPVVNEFLKGQGVSVGPVTVIDFQDPSPEVYILTSLVKTASDADGETPIRVNALASRLVKGKIVMIGATSRCDTEDDIAWAKAAALECAKSAR